MAQELIIARLDDLPLDRFAGLLAESETSGYRFLRRVVDEWASGVNRFVQDRPYARASVVSACGAELAEVGIEGAS
jgi:hypothetical protein